jgi:hypothetical protein
LVQTTGSKRKGDIVLAGIGYVINDMQPTVRFDMVLFVYGLHEPLGITLDNLRKHHESTQKFDLDHGLSLVKIGAATWTVAPMGVYPRIVLTITE